MQRTLKIIAVAVVLILVAGLLHLIVPRHDYFLTRAGKPDVIKHRASTADGVVDEHVQITGTTGLAVRFRVRRPAGVPGPLPLLVVVGGHRTGQDAVELVGAPDDMAYLAIDYPYAGEHRLRGWRQWLRAVPLIQQAFLDTPPALSLALSWALQQPWADPARAELIGVSLGVPFAAAAGAVDTRFSRVWLLHGGVDNRSWLSFVGREHINNDTLRSLMAGAALTMVHGNSFDTRHWIGETAPRPLVFVAACDDDYVPRAAVQSLLQAPASDHVEIVWTSGLHINPRRPHELRQLLDTVTSRVAGRPSPPSTDCAAASPSPRPTPP